MDFIRQFFEGRPEHVVGPTGLPKDIEDDLRKNKSYNPKQQQDYHQQWNSDVHIDKEFEQMFQNMNDIFRDLLHDTPKIEFHYDFQDNNNVGENEKEEKKSLREKMLKEDEIRQQNIIPFGDRGLYQSEDEHPFFQFPRGWLLGGLFNFPSLNEGMSGGRSEAMIPQEDQDFDEDVRNGTHSLDDILQNNKIPNERSRDDTFSHPLFLWDRLTEKDGGKDNFKSAFQYSSTVRKVGPDGSIEVKSSRRDSQGNEEVTVTRSLGDQTHTVMNKKNIEGVEEIKEDFVNMDQDDLRRFEEKWKENGSGDDNKSILLDGKPSDIFSQWWKPKL